MLHLAAAAGLALALPAHADFSGYYAPANWTIEHVPDASTDGGSMDFSGAPGSVKLIGSDLGTDESSRIEFVISAQAAGTVSFDWLYETFDVGTENPPSPPEAWDFAGYRVNATVFTLSDGTSGQIQSGNVSFAVAAGDTFGFTLESLDNFGGPAEMTISNFSAPIPEPASMAMMGLGLAAVAGVAARRRRAR